MRLPKTVHSLPFAFAFAFAFTIAFVVGPAPAQAYQLLGSNWDADKGPVVYHLEPSGVDDLDDGSDLDGVRQAFRSWACVEGSRLRFVEGVEAGVKQVALDDGINSVFWDEDGSFGLGPATLGITVGSAPQAPGETVVRDAADIVFNGFDHEWATDEEAVRAGKVDVGSIAIHETGHWLGLGHPCDDPAETQCLGPDKAVMTPFYPGGTIREPLADDVAGIQALYPATDESRCDGPFRQGEACACNDLCVSGLLCVEGLDGSPVCAPKCSSEDVTCPAGFACVLGARPTNGDPAQGSCIRLGDDGLKPLASSCQRDSDCSLGLCVATDVIGRTVCKKSCDSREECPAGYRCTEGVCVGQGASDGIACPEPQSENPPLCGCHSARSGAPSGVLLLSLALGALYGSNRRRGPFAKSDN